MATKGKGKRDTVYAAAAGLVICYLAQTIDCYRLTKAERREGRNEAKTTGVSEGTIVFGTVFERGSGLQPQVLDEAKKSSSNASAADEAAYQADSPVLPNGQLQDISSKEALWRRMAPSLHCGLDQLRFRAVGPGASRFAVEQRNSPPVPLYKVPSTCGYSLQRNSLALALRVPFDGCNVAQEGGSYVLPMRWHGIPVSLWCPNPAATPQDPPIPQEPHIPLLPHEPQVPLWPHDNRDPNFKFPPTYSFFPPHHLQNPDFPPAVWPVKEPANNPEIPKLPPYHPGFSPFYSYFLPYAATTAPPTTTPETFPFIPPHFHAYPWQIPVPLPADGKFQSPVIPPHGHFFPKFFHPFQTPMPITMPPTTTTVPPSDVKPHFHLFDHFHVPLKPYHHV